MEAVLDKQSVEKKEQLAAKDPPQWFLLSLGIRQFTCWVGCTQGGKSDGFLLS